MMTAIQIAIENYKKDGVSFTDWFMDNYELLLQIEKVHIKEAHRNGYSISFIDGDIRNFNRAEEYYNQTYKPEII